MASDEAATAVRITAESLTRTPVAGALLLAVGDRVLDRPVTVRAATHLASGVTVTGTSGGTWGERLVLPPSMPVTLVTT